MIKRFLSTATLIIFACTAATAGQNLNYVDLVHKMTDMEGLAVLPEPGEMCAQWSTYQRVSRYDDQTGKYVRWDANGDAVDVIRMEGDSGIAAEMEGPGCIWRIWSADPKNGHIKIFLDGADQPAVDLPFIGLFNMENPPFVYPALVHTAATGYNSYVPIPFRKSCRIVMEKDWGRFYHFTYSIFPDDTVVPTFKCDLASEEKRALLKADWFLRKRLGTDPAGTRAGEKTDVRKIELAAGKSVTVADLTGKRAITGMWVKVDPALLANSPRILRDVVLTIKWDGEKQPSVWSPLGDFFGTGSGFNKYESLPLGMTDKGFYSYWYMPFAKGAVVELVNEGVNALSGEITITHAPVTRPIEKLGRFHAKWHRDAFLPSEPERYIDWTMLTTGGKGRFCGAMLNVWNPKRGWWGEGDEKFFVDGENFPSTYGTGAEDYFGYAWGSSALFQNAYHNQTLNTDLGGFKGEISVNRWQIADNVPFQKSFEGSIEKYYSNLRPCLFASIVYWYLDPNGVDPYGPVPVEDRILSDVSKPFSVPGALEGENLKILSATGKAEPKNIDVASNGGYLWWSEAQPGDKLDVALPVLKTGNYNIKAQFIEGIKSGKVQLYLDGEKIGKPFDLYDDSPYTVWDMDHCEVCSGEISFGNKELTAGEHKLTVEIVGANEQAKQWCYFGLDYVKMLPEF